MAFSRPTLSEIVDRVQQDLLSRVGGEAPVLRRAMIHVLAKVIAGAVHMLHGHLEYLGKQIFPDLSEGDFLLRQAGLFGLSRIAASYATGSVICTGTDGSVIPAGALLTRADGAGYEVAADATIASGTATANVLARTAGAAGNAPAGVSLSFESPIAGVNSSAIVAPSGLSGGADEETDEALRIRLLARMQSPPHGGSAADYVAWAKEVAGVTRAWCYPLENGPGTVTVRFVRDNDTSMIPDAGEVAAVQAHLDAVRPVTAVVTVAAPTAAPLALTIALTPNTAATRAAVTAELQDLLRRTGEPGGIFLRSQLDIAVGTAEGVTDFELIAPIGDVVCETGQISTLGEITWL